MQTGDLVATAGKDAKLTEMEFYYEGIEKDNNFKNTEVKEGDKFIVKQLNQKGIRRRSEIFEEQMRKFDPNKKSDHEIRTQLHDYANVYSIWAGNDQTTDKEALAATTDYDAFLRGYDNLGKVVDDLGLVLAGREANGLRDRVNEIYLVRNFGASGFKPMNAANPNDNQVRHFVGYLLGAKQAYIGAPLFSYWREIRQGAEDTVQDINLAWGAFKFWDTYLN